MTSLRDFVAIARPFVLLSNAVNFGTRIIGGAVIEPGTTLLPLSLVLKEMHLPAATCEGSPAEPLIGNK
jgi:hypothetical protein